MRLRLWHVLDHHADGFPLDRLGKVEGAVRGRGNGRLTHASRSCSTKTGGSATPDLDKPKSKMSIKLLNCCSCVFDMCRGAHSGRRSRWRNSKGGARGPGLRNLALGRSWGNARPALRPDCLEQSCTRTARGG